MTMEDHKKAKLLKKILGSKSLPSLSPLAIQLVELASDEQSSARDLAGIIENDPALATRLLKLVGSAFFALPSRVSSISHAVVLLGFKRVRVMALSLSLRDTFAMGTKGGLDYDHFWKSSLYRAMIARGFAEWVQAPNLNPEEAFVGSLILEIGSLMLYEVCPDELKQDFPGGSMPLKEAVSWEEQNLGVNHRELGSLALRRWGFSDHLVEAQRYFGPEAVSPERSMLCKTVDLARRATQIIFGQRTNLYEVQQLVHRLLKLNPADLDGILSEAFDKVEVLAEQLRIKVDSQTDILRVMETANETLARINASMETSLQELLDHVGEYDQSLTRISEKMAQSRKEILQNTLDAVAHEIRNPLLAIGGFANRLANQAKEENKGRQYAKIIAEESTRLEYVLKDITEYCQDYEPSFAERDMVSIANDVLDELEDLFREKHIDVVRKFPEESVIAAVDMDGISRVLRQLFENAVSMIDQPGGRVILSVQPPSGTGRVLSIGISDNGRSMPEDVRDALLDSNLSTKTFGEGFGLPMARKIIEAHKGHIEIKDREGRGNSVVCYFPMP